MVDLSLATLLANYFRSQTLISSKSARSYMLFLSRNIIDLKPELHDVLTQYYRGYCELCTYIWKMVYHGQRFEHLATPSISFPGINSVTVVSRCIQSSRKRTIADCAYVNRDNVTNVKADVGLHDGLV
eukprot:scaffold101590_cov19-Prasinocladus_malaysianus.AAC.2